MKLAMLLFSCLMLICSLAYADEYDEMQQLVGRSLALQLMEESRRHQENGAVIRATSDTCLSAPLPTEPKTPQYPLMYTYEHNGEKLSMVFWREVCQDDTGVALLMRATPKVGSPLLCSPQFTIIQNDVQHNDLKLQSEPGGDDRCVSDLRVPITLIVNEYEFGQEQFDPAGRLTIIFSFSDDEVSLEIPSSTAAIPSVDGKTNGYKKYRATCKNMTTEKVAQIPLQRGSKPWDCGEAGLSIKSGDKIRVTITGTAK